MIRWRNSILYGAGTDSPELGPFSQAAVPLLCTEQGIQYVQLATDEGKLPTLEPDSDGISSDDLRGIFVNNANLLFNGTTWDRERGNTSQTMLASAARTANTVSADFTNYNARGGHFIIDVTAITATPSITPTIEVFDVASSTYYPVLIGPAISTVSTNVLKVYPGLSAVPNNVAGDILPRTFRVNVAHADADSITYSVGVNLVL